MNIFGIGPLEIVFVVLIGILVLGPEEMVKTGRKLGKFIHSIVTSQWWQSVQSGMDEVQNLPSKWMREAELEKFNELYNLDNEYVPPGPKDDQLRPPSEMGSSTAPGRENDAEETPPDSGDEKEPSSS
jgi:Sec-independent protein translocase protein TatA